MTIKLGDTVVLRGTGQAMTVIGLSARDAAVEWTTERGARCRGQFPVAAFHVEDGSRDTEAKP